MIANNHSFHEDELHGSYVFPASTGQERLWFLQQLDEKLGSVYNIATAFKISTHIDRISLQKALNVIVDRYEVLRTALFYKEHSLKQSIKPRFFKTVNFVDCSEKIKLNSSFIFDDMKNQVNQVFDFSNHGLFNVILYKESDSTYFLLIVIHHSIADGVSFEIIINELFQCYLIFRSNEHESKINNILPKVELQFSDIVEWDKEWFSTKEYIKHEAYWKNKLKDINLPNINLLSDNFNKKEIVDNYEGSIKEFKLDHKTIKVLEKISVSLETTDYVLLLTSFALLIYYYTMQKDFLIGVPVSGRPNNEIANIVGFLANTVVIRIEINDEITIRELIKQIQNSVMESMQYQRFPYIKIHENLLNKSRVKHRDVFYNMFGFQEVINKDKDYSLFTNERLNIDSGLSRFDLSFFVFKENNIIKGFLEYRSKVFTNEKIEDFIYYFKSIIHAVNENYDSYIKEINYISNVKMCSIYEYSNNFKINNNNVDKTIMDKLKLYFNDNIIPEDAVFYITDNNMKILPLGSVGELLVKSSKSINTESTFVEDVSDSFFSYLSDINLNDDDKRKFVFRTGIYSQLNVIKNTLRHITVSSEGSENNIIDNNSSFVESTSETEKRLEKCWQSLLNINKKISVHSSFFDLGGSSLLVAKMVDLVSRDFRVALPIRDIFFNPTISYISNKINSLKM